MGVLAIVLIACAVVFVVGAEWPRLAAWTGAKSRVRRKRARRKSGLTVIEGEGGDDRDDFERSVERDLENLPVLPERDDRSRR
ncbi:MAG TPA: hypothetical protein VGJ34_03225 [Gaiellaceae bacterium]